MSNNIKAGTENGLSYKCLNFLFCGKYFDVPTKVVHYYDTEVCESCGQVIREANSQVELVCPYCQSSKFIFLNIEWWCETGQHVVDVDDIYFLFGNNLCRKHSCFLMPKEPILE